MAMVVLIVLLALFIGTFIIACIKDLPDCLVLFLLEGLGIACGAIIGLGFQNNNMKQNQDALQSLMSIILKK